MFLSTIAWNPRKQNQNKKERKEKKKERKRKGRKSVDEILNSYILYEFKILRNNRKWVTCQALNSSSPDLHQDGEFSPSFPARFSRIFNQPSNNPNWSLSNQIETWRKGIFSILAGPGSYWASGKRQLLWNRTGIPSGNGKVNCASRTNK